MTNLQKFRKELKSLGFKKLTGFQLECWKLKNIFDVGLTIHLPNKYHIWNNGKSVNGIISNLNKLRSFVAAKKG